MKKFFVSIIVAALVGMAAMCVAIMFDASDKVAIVCYFGTSAVVCLVMGAFDVKERRGSYTSFKDAARYGNAAIIIGSACLFHGTLADCEELCDDLWHRGVQAEVRELTGEETFEIL